MGKALLGEQGWIPLCSEPPLVPHSPAAFPQLLALSWLPQHLEMFFQRHWWQLTLDPPRALSPGASSSFQLGMWHWKAAPKTQWALHHLLCHPFFWGKIKACDSLLSWALSRNHIFTKTADSESFYISREKAEMFERLYQHLTKEPWHLDTVPIKALSLQHAWFGL